MNSLILNLGLISRIAIVLAGLLGANDSLKVLSHFYFNFKLHFNGNPINLLFLKTRLEKIKRIKLKICSFVNAKFLLQ